MNEEDQQRGGSGVLVVIPVNDCAPRLLTTTLDSLAVQSLDSDDYKVLFVENGPQSCKLLGLLSSISSIDGYQACSIERLSLPEPQSELHVRRLGAEFCASRYLLFLDPGDQIDSAFLEKSVLALNNCECAGWVNPVKQELLPIMRQVQPKLFSALLALCKPVVSSGHMYRTQEWLSASRKTPSVIADVDLFGEWHVQIRLMGKGLWGYPLRDAVYIGERDTKPVSMLDTKRYMAGIYLTLRKNMAVLPLVIRAMSAFKREWRKGWGYKSKLNPGWVLDKIQAVALKRFGFGDVSASLGGKGILLAILFPEKFIHRLLTTNSNISLAEIHCEFFTKPNLDFSPTTYQPTGSNSVLFAHSHWAVGGSERVLLAWMRAVRPHVAGRIIDVCGRESKQGSGERSEEGNAYYHQGVRDEFAGLCDVQFSLEGMGDTPLQRIRICWDIICRERPTLIFISGNAYMYALLPLIRKWFPEIVVADILHNEWYNHRDWFNISSEYSRYIDKRVTISEYWRSILVDKYGENRDRVSVFLNSIDLQHFDPGRYVDARHRSLDESDPNCKKIAFIGRLHEQKRPEVFFELAKQFLAVDGYRFVVVGDGTEKSALLNRYSGLKNLVCLGASDDVPGVLATVDLVVFSSVFEGYPLTSLEASAMGVPFIAPDIIGFREQVEDGGGGLLYQASSDECRDAVLIKQLIEQRWDELTKMGGRGRTFVETVHSSSVLEPRYGEFLAGLMRDAGSKRQRAQGSNGGKKLFLHIGIPKTGSTSIQYFMDVNRKHLARQGVLYPKHYMCGYGQHPFAWACMKEGANQNRTFVEYMERYGKSLSQLESDLRVLLETLQRSNSDSVVVSSEAFTRSDPEMVKDLLTGFDVTIIVFLRRQDLYLESSYNQNKKVRPSEVNLNRYLSRNKPTLDYEALLDAWSGCFGKENIVVTPFERNIFSGGLERYFLSLLGVQWNQTYKTELKNPGLNRDCLAFLSEHFLPEEVGDRERGRIIDMLSQYSREHPDDESLKYNLSPATRLEIIEKYREINREVARKYLGREDGVLF
ncbi:MAG: glycosyltransferase, partial [Gammaproteobacteria bacterium]|nr:glycosyltransferase [Gammaproteobacteria bacterium]